MNTETTPRIYVGTYAKYNNGSIEGAWLDLEDYPDREAFLEACAELHEDEKYPEFMFQDFEGFPKAFYSESSIPTTLWDWLELDEDDRELLAIYNDHCNSDGDIDEARERFQGKFDSEIDWAYEQIDSGCYLDGVSEFVKRYFDYGSFLIDCKCGGDVTFVYHNGDHWAFSNN